MRTKYASLQIQYFRNLFFDSAISSQKKIFWQLVSIYQYFGGYFHCACAETAISVPSFRSTEIAVRFKHPMQFSKR